MHISTKTIYPAVLVQQDYSSWPGVKTVLEENQMQSYYLVIMMTQKILSSTMMKKMIFILVKQVQVKKSITLVTQKNHY